MDPQPNSPKATAVADAEIFSAGDYVSPGLRAINLDRAFPNMVVGDPAESVWPQLRRDVPHNWHVDRRSPKVGFLTRDEVHLLYNNALQFHRQPALEIGCWMGWSTAHLYVAGVHLHVVDPVIRNPRFRETISESLQEAAQVGGVAGQVFLHDGSSPLCVKQLAAQGHRWSLFAIDGDHSAPQPLLDATICAEYATADAMILLNGLAVPDVAQALDHLMRSGWNTMVYQTMQIMGVAWRGAVAPVRHQPDPRIRWSLPTHLAHFRVSQFTQAPAADVSPSPRPSANPTLAQAPPTANEPPQEFKDWESLVRPYTLLSQARLYSLYSRARQVCEQGLAGDFVECGACRGGSSALLAAVLKKYTQRPRKLYSFDTFEGMPDPTEVDRHAGILANDTNFGAGTLKAPLQENLEKTCREMDVLDVVEPVAGLFADTFPIYSPQIESIALLHADADWYESTMDIFNTFYDVVVPSGYVQVDDYGFWEGCKKAVHDFEQSRGTKFKFHLHQIDFTGVWFQKNPSPQPRSTSMQTASPMNRQTVNDYRQLYQMSLAEWMGYHQQHVVFHKCNWMGIRALTNPFDAWIYQEILYEVQPEVIIEIGSNEGGSTLFFAHMLDLLKKGSVISIDIDRSRFQAKHDRITTLTGDCSSPEILGQVESLCAGKPTLVIHDGDHSQNAVLRDLGNYARFVSVGSYLIVEDGVLDVLENDPRFRMGTQGPLPASDQFVAENPNFVVDLEKERYLMTYNPRGFLRRVH